MVNKYDKIATNCAIEFDDIMDFIWKSPNIIDHETKVEKSKRYFEENSELHKLRAEEETRKLKGVFPYLITVGNLFSVMSAFETYLYLVTIELEKDTKKNISEIKGAGINRIFKYLKYIGVNYDKIDYYLQINAAIKIRNCFIHASGQLTWSKEKEILNNIVKSGEYLTKDHLKNRRKNANYIGEIYFIKNSFGTKLQIKNDYVHTLSGYLLQYFLLLCEEIKSHLNEEK